MFFDLLASEPFAPAKIAAALRAILLALAEAFYVPSPAHPRTPLIIPFQSYLQRIFLRFARLVERHEAGTLTPPRKRAKRTTPEKPRANPRLRLPQRKAWVTQEVGVRAVWSASALRTLFERPETAQLLAQIPQAQRLLRPLCRMLGITTPAIPALKRRPRKPRPAKPRRLTRKQREAILWYPNSEGKPMKLLPRRLPRD